MSPDGFETRPARVEDVADATALINEFGRFYVGDAMDRESEEDIRDWWSEVELDRDTLVAREAATGRLRAVGILETRNRKLSLDGYVHPDARGRGLGSALAAWAEDETRRRELDRVGCVYLTADTAAAMLFEGRGYEYARTFYRMTVEPESPPPSPDWPAECTLATREPANEADFHAVLEEAFAESWGHVARPLDAWLARVGTMHADPELWFLVRCDGDAAAAAVCAQSFGMGWIGIIGVLPAWRRRGIARALLLHAMGALYATGERRLGLGVDAMNETGATRLYESVGMSVAWRADFVERAID